MKQDTIFSRRDFFRHTGQGVALTGGVLLTASTTHAGLPEAPPSSGEGSKLLVGWATVSITPDKPVQLAGQFHERVSNDILCPCMATALALESEDGKEQAIMIACDLVNVDFKNVLEIRARVAGQLPGFDPSKLLINTTHTHTGPTLRTGSYKDPDPGVMGPVEYAPFFCERATEAAVQAWAARQPGAISHALGHAAVGFNRIAVFADGSSRMYGKSDHPDFRGLESGHDHGLELIFFWDAQERLTGIAINIACPSQVVEGQRYISADFWGPARETLHELYGDSVFIYPMVSAAGDQSPRDLVRRGRGEADMRSEAGMREMARRIVNGVQYAFETARSQPSTHPVFKHHTERLELPLRQVSSAEAAEAQKEYDRILDSEAAKPGSRDEAMLRRMKAVIDRYEKQTHEDGFAFDLHAMRLGDIAIATNPFELYLDYGLRIKALSPAFQTCIVQLTNDHGRYLPTQRAVAGGAYGGRITENRVGPEGGEILVNRTLEILKGLWKNK